MSEKRLILFRAFKKGWVSLLTFLSGVGALYCADMWIATSASTDVVKQWAVLKSYMMVAGVFSLFGIEQLIVRHPRQMSYLLKIGLLNVLVVGCFVTYVAERYGFVSNAFDAAVATVFFGFTTLFFQWHRSALRLTDAYLSSGAWRICFLVCVLLFVRKDIDVSISNFLHFSFIVGFFLNFLLILKKRDAVELRAAHADLGSLKEVYGVSLGYLIASLSLALASYGETLVVNKLGAGDDVVEYFRAGIGFLFPGLVINQYATAVVGNRVRQNEKVVLEFLKKYRRFLFVALVLIFPALIGCGYCIEILIYGEFKTEMPLAFVMALTGVVRIVYILPSSFVGIVATKRQIYVTSLYYFALAVLMPVLAFGFVHYGFFSVVMAVASANCMSWFGRCAVGLRIVSGRLRTTC